MTNAEALALLQGLLDRKLARLESLGILQEFLQDNPKLAHVLQAKRKPAIVAAPAF